MYQLEDEYYRGWLEGQDRRAFQGIEEVSDRFDESACLNCLPLQDARSHEGGIQRSTLKNPLLASQMQNHPELRLQDLSKLLRYS